MTITIHHSTVQTFLGERNDTPFDAVLCDPPYELGFMGKHWDRSGVALDSAVWRGIYDLMKPGAYLLAFGGTRTFHRLAVAIEDAGFEIRDCMMYVHGSGFPKSHNISKAIDKAAGAEREVVGAYDTRGLHESSKAGRKSNGVTGNEVFNPVRGCDTKIVPITTPATESAALWDGYGTALKPAWEPIVVAMKPIEGTFAANAMKWGVGGMNVNASRIEASPWFRKKGENPTRNFTGTYAQDEWTKTKMAAGANEHGSDGGRWPANLIHDGSDEVMELFPETKSGLMRAGQKRVSTQGYGGGYYNSMPDVMFNDTYGDSGSASRFFYCAKAHKRERNAGLDDMETMQVGTTYDKPARNRNGKDSGYSRQNHHPTVKPLELTKYLATLILPPQRGTPRRVLVPFAGSGSEMIGAMLAGWDEVVGVEMSPEYVAIARARLVWWEKIKDQIRSNDIRKILAFAKSNKVGGSRDEAMDGLPLFPGGTGEG